MTHPAERVLDAAYARHLDDHDPFPTRRADFHIPPHGDGEVAYFAGNSLGLQPRVTAGRLQQELDDWAALAVEGHLEATRPWLPYHRLLREPAARLVGALPEEVVMMNTLTVNLHLMMVSFYRPTPQRHAILIEDTTFPSDGYAVRSQSALHGYDPDEAIIRLSPRAGEACLRSEDVVDFLAREGHRVAMVLLGGINYYSGERLDIPSITAAGHAAGAIVGWDLAHAAGNVPVDLHDAGVDWAAWCTYKYLNSGPGAVAGAFVHSRHLADRSLPKLAGWWSSKEETRFQMGPTVDPVDTADSWQLSNPPILALAPVLASLEIFDEVGLTTLRDKSIRLTLSLEAALDAVSTDRPLEIITPRNPDTRGAQLSVRLHRHDAGAVCADLRHEHGVIADARQPDVVRLAPVPLYSTFADCQRAATALAAVIDAHG